METTINKSLIAKRFAKARNTYDHEARVQLAVAEKMLRLLLPYTPPSGFRHLVEIGCGTGLYSRLLIDAFHPTSLLLNDLCPEMEECVSRLCTQPTIRFVAGDAETLPLFADAGSTDLITSCSTLQWFTGPEDFFRRSREALTPQGILAFSTFGPDNLRELRQLTGHGLDYLPTDRLATLLTRVGFRLLHLEEEEATLHFAQPVDVLRHLQRTGVTGTEKRPWTRTRLQHFCDEYVRLFAREDGRVTLTYHPIFAVATPEAS